MTKHLLILALATIVPAHADDLSELRRQVSELTTTVRALQQQLDQVAVKRKLETPMLETGLAAQGKQASAAPIPTGTRRADQAPRLCDHQERHLDISLIATFSAGTSSGDPAELQLGGHDPGQRGFNVQAFDLTLSGAVDPYFRALGTVTFGIDTGGETFVEIEEAWMETASLPWNLTLRGGQLLTAFGHLNTKHLHAWDFVDLPLVNARFLGGDGLRAPGAQVSWLMPAPFSSELFYSLQNSPGGHEHGHGEAHAHDTGGEPRGTASFDDMLHSVRWAVSADLGAAHTLLTGVSVAIGRNEFGRGRQTRLLGADLRYKWQPADHAGGYPFVVWQTEAMLRHIEGRFEREEKHDAEAEEEAGHEHATYERSFDDWGIYSFLGWGFARGWVAGLRGDYVQGLDEIGEEGRWRVSPNLTWHPTEFSKLRLQYNFDHRDGIGGDHSVWFQFEFSLGQHGSH